MIKQTLILQQDKTNIDFTTRILNKTTFQIKNEITYLSEQRIRLEGVVTKNINHYQRETSPQRERK